MRWRALLLRPYAGGDALLSLLWCSCGAWPVTVFPAILPAAEVRSGLSGPVVFCPSAYQQRIFDFVRSGSGDGVVRATAGSGKTTTLVELARLLPDDLNAVFLAFNRHSAGELKERLPRHVRSATIHSLGNASLMRAYPHLRGRKPEGGKLRALVRQRLQTLAEEFAAPREVIKVTGEYLYHLTRFAMLNLTDPRDVDRVAALGVEYNLTPPADSGLERQCHLEVRPLLRARLDALKTHGVYDFDDMLYLPAVLNLPVEQFDFIFVDEAQDLSSLQLDLVMRVRRPGGRRLFVGDERQAIYGFAGADQDSLLRIVQRTGATILPLSISYRCPRSHVALASRLAPEIEAAPDAVDGRVLVIGESEMDAYLEPGVLVLCRYTAPLVVHCLRQLKAGRPAVVRGMDIGQRLKDMVSLLFPASFRGWERRLDLYRVTEVARLTASASDDDDLERQVSLRMDLINCLQAIVRSFLDDGLSRPADLASGIGELFSDHDAAVVFSTIHKAKGLEAEVVLVLSPENMPARYARTDLAARGEACVQFVALTRSKRDLIFVRQSPRESVSAADPGLGLSFLTGQEEERE